MYYAADVEIRGKMHNALFVVIMLKNLRLFQICRSVALLLLTVLTKDVR